MQVIPGFPSVYSNGSCQMCGWAGLDDSRNILDTGIMVDETNLYFCELCVRAFAGMFGMVDATPDVEDTRVAELLATHEKVSDNVSAISTAIVELGNLLPGIANLGELLGMEAARQEGNESPRGNSDTPGTDAEPAPVIDKEPDFTIVEGSISVPSGSGNGFDELREQLAALK